MPLDIARSAFEWLVTGPSPVSVDGRLFPGMPVRQVPLDELRDRLLHRRCPQSVRDQVWAHLVLLSRAQGGTWTVGAVGVALPALLSIAATLSAKFAGDSRDVHAAVLSGFVAELGQVDLHRPRIMLRLRWAAYRAGHAAVREALDAPTPCGHGVRATAPSRPWGHPDFVLARAVAEGVITAPEAELIGSTRLEDVPLVDAAALRGMTYQAVKKARQRAERRLVDYLLDSASPDGTAEPGGTDLVDQVVNAVLITEATKRGPRRTRKSRSATGSKSRHVAIGLSPANGFPGVQGCAGTSPASAHTTSSPELPQRPSGSTPGAPRCA
ncbi:MULTISPECIES: hypothetical protein [Actinosynnema]|uniref:hypothetical protein n=1 Tax=Actinosynnema TaxID=40566 RepID=UPI0020A53C55|nr:hypothetical protein [Actinosynnema pretiosum]